MKLRIRGDSIRLRLTRPEVDQLAEKGLVEESTTFGVDRFSYAIATTLTSGMPKLAARLVGARIEVMTTPEAAREWAKSDAVGLETFPSENASETKNGREGRTLRIIVEKDFACLKDRADEPDGDAFPNPNTTC